MAFVGAVRPAIMPTVHGFRLHIPRGDRSPYVLSLFLEREYEPEESRVIAETLRPGDVAFDVGANVGYMTCLMASRVGDGRVHAFEPEPRHFRVLRENIALNGFSNVVANQVALGAAAGTGQLYLAAENLGDHTLVAGTAGRVEEVEITSFDLYRQRHCPGATIRLVKIDVQGYEAHVLRGMAGSLHRGEIETVVVELTPARMKQAGESLASIAGFFAGLPYRVELLSQSMHPPLQAFEEAVQGAPRLEADPFAAFNVILTRR